VRTVKIREGRQDSRKPLRFGRHPGASKITLFIVLITGAGSVVLAQEESAQENTKPPEFLTAVPESPAFTFLGTTPAEVTRPGSVRDLALALINGVDADGRVVSGFAMEASLWQILPGVRVPLTQYQNSRWSYALANTQASLGTARSNGEPGATDISLGLKFILFDAGDPMHSPQFTKELGNALVACLPESPNAPQEPTLECVDKVIAVRFERWTQENWNALQVSVAVASGWQLVDWNSELDGHMGLQAWAVASGPLGKKVQILGQLEYRDQPQLVGRSEFSRWSLGARGIFGSPVLNGFIEVIGERFSSPAVDENRVLWSVGADLRIARNLWVSVGLGRRFEALDPDARTAVLANLRWGILGASRIAKMGGLASGH
jgi:hypothetical protein